jgi:hypothetical protein
MTMTKPPLPDFLIKLNMVQLLIAVESAGGEAIVGDLLAQLDWDQRRFNKSFARLSGDEPPVFPHNKVGLTEAGRAIFEAARET